MNTAHGEVVLEEGLPVLKTVNVCYAAENEAVTRLIGLLLRSSVAKEIIARQLSGIICCPLWVDGVQVKSPADAMARLLMPGPPKGQERLL